MWRSSYQYLAPLLLLSRPATLSLMMPVIARNKLCTFAFRFSTKLFSTKSNLSINEERKFKYQQLMDASTLSLAPMMEYTDRHFRHLVRLISRRTLLYTEMVAANALCHERADKMSLYLSTNPDADNTELRSSYNADYLSRFLSQSQVDPLEGPSVLQLGGSDPEQMFKAAQTVMDLTDRGGICDYTAINLNCGCPSPKVAGKGCFGAALMDEPNLVAQLTQSLNDGCEGRLPITVKCRIGTDTERPFHKLEYADLEPELEYQKLCHFIETVASNGVVTDFSVHARIAVLTKSFSPADNRKIPPLKYDVVRRLVKDFPDLTFSLNGGVESIPQVKAELEAAPGLKGVMIGRSWAADPWSFAMTDALLYNENESSLLQNRLEILKDYCRHADEEEERGDPVRIRRFIVKAIMPLFAGEANAKRYRVALDDIASLPKKLHSKGITLQNQPPLSELILNAAMEHLSEEALLRSPKDSYDRLLWLSEKSMTEGSRSSAVMEWQAERKEQQAASG